MYFNTMVEGVIGHVVLQIKRLVSNVKYPATITLSRTEINTKHIYDCMPSTSWYRPRGGGRVAAVAGMCAGRGAAAAEAR